jgi:protein-tyrosine phosphatase
MRAEIYWIEHEGPGRLAIMPRPRGRDWLQEEIEAMAKEGVRVLVSHLTAGEAAECGLQEEGRLCEEAGIEFVSFGIADRGVPGMDEAEELVAKLVERMKRERAVAVHCRAGIGRSALTAAAVLWRLGVGPEEAFRRISQARGMQVPDTQEQIEWVKGFCRRRPYQA